VTWSQRIGWAALAIATLAIAAAPDVITLPQPDAQIVLSNATYTPDNGSSRAVALPHAIYPQFSRHPNLVRYAFNFDLPADSEKNLFLFIPSINRRVSLALNGDSFYGFESSALWTGPLVSSSVMVRLPRAAMVAGRNQLMVMVETGPFATPFYISRVYLGSEAAMAPNYKIRVFLNDQLKTMVFAAHLLLGLGLIFAYFFRPNDPLYAWLAVFNVSSGIISIGMFVGFQPIFRPILPYVVVLYPTVGFLLIGIALSLINKRPPRILYIMCVAVPLTLFPTALIDTNFAKSIAAASAAAIIAGSFIFGTFLIAWGAIRWRNPDARLMLGPIFLIAWYSVRDVYVTATLPAHAFNLLATYPKPLFLAFLIAVLMRRLGVSLDSLDHANETLAIKLAAREAELAALSKLERVEATRLTRDQERQRLTHDLHDGLSGHLVSIIALSERSGEKPIEQAARDALNDLRLVIYSLDLGDRELPLALANFRERLIPQLARLGVELDWSMAGLPEVSGVTPGNALAILRILQEAITNALKHGPARKITIRGALSDDNRVALFVANDGAEFGADGVGNGLANMRRRAHHLRGELTVKAIAGGTLLVLLLPLGLPDFEDENAA
jgi:two-component system sensor histidine kinase UhpB